MEISKDEFEQYEEVRKGGLTNMFNVGLVAELSGLTKEQIFFIMKNYGELKKKYCEAV